jgi:hypothetical protein
MWMKDPIIYYDLETKFSNFGYMEMHLFCWFDQQTTVTYDIP